MPSNTRNIPLGYALGLFGVVIFGGTLPATVLALPSFGPLFIASSRAAAAALIAVLVLVVRRRRLDRRDLGSVFVAGLMVTFGFPALSSLAMQTVDASHGGVVLGILPLATAAFAVLLTGERPGTAFWLWSIAGAVLVTWFVLGQNNDGEPGFESGDFWLVAAALSAAFGYVVMGRLSDRMPGWEVICWALVLTAPLNFALTAWLWEDRYLDPQPVAALALGYHALFSMFLGFFFWNAGLALGGIARIGQVQLLQVFVTVALSAALLDETITARTVLFAAAVAATVWLGRKARAA
ncbi:DMT family transporter [Oricola thermophila]|uniref:DMT family transporter n=1 Tax=Oricola thermophila TaxID=2742145 RepID=A0A6N1VBI2_9HYPH|nr:DMT family transporter [Oricola thermophila]QKV18371.1 DMT family transporter [Oricola thermophila]